MEKRVRLIRSICLFQLLLLLPCLLAMPSARSQSIRFLEDKKLFVLESGPVSYVFGINERNELQHVYWGGKVTRDADFQAVHSTREWSGLDLSTAYTPQEYAGWGAGVYTEPALKVTWPDGNRDLVLHYDSYKIAGDTLTVQLKDISRPIYVELR